MVIESYGLKDIYLIMTTQELIDRLQPFFYGDTITIKKFGVDDISVFVDGLYFNRELINKHTGIDLSKIRLRDDNLELWKELGK